LLSLATSTGLAQFGGLGDKLTTKLPNIFGGASPITTSLSDAKWEDPSKAGFTPSEEPRALMTLKRTPEGGFLLEQGYFVEELQSYCLMAGTHGASGRDGDAYSPIQSGAADAVVTILHGAVRHPDIDQHDIQALLWAIVARATFEDL